MKKKSLKKKSTAIKKKVAPKKSENFFLYLLWIILIALIFRAFLFQSYNIPSGSMLPTLQIQDKILVEKLTPRIISKSNLSKLKNKIVVFNVPNQLIKAGYDADTALIKRVIGVPGDKVEVKEGNLYLNDIAQSNYISDSNINYSTGPFVVPEKSLWVMGDNRNNSMDSHIWGFLPYKNVIGKAIFRYWPLNNIGPIRFPSLNNVG